MQKQLESSESKDFEVLPSEDYGMKFLTAIVENGSNDLFLCQPIRTLIEFLFLTYKKRILKFSFPIYVL